LKISIEIGGKKKKKLGPVELIESIDVMKLHDWEQLNIKKGEDKLFHMYKHEEDHGRLVDPKELEEKYYQLHDENGEQTGGNDIIEKLLVLFVKRLEARAKMGTDKSQKNFVVHYSEMIRVLMEGSGDVDIIKTRMMVQKAYGQHIDPKVITVTEYNKIMDVVKEMAGPTNKA
jgi:hypothetical protein